MSAWKRASGCSDGSCVEVLHRADEDGVVLDGVWVRNSTDPDLVVKFTPAEWSVFTSAVRNGEF